MFDELKHAWFDLLRTASASLATAVAFLSICGIFLLGLWKAWEIMTLTLHLIPR